MGEDISRRPCDVVLHGVVLDGHGGDKLAVINVVRRVLSSAVGLMEVKRLVESPPFVVREQIPRPEAEELAAELRRAGAEVEVR
jgi:large subunit ribosomal protein L7/L12